MSGFITVLGFLFNFLPGWLSFIVFTVLAIVSVLIVLAVVKAVLDAIPFV